MSTIYPVTYAFGDSLSDAGDAYLLTNSSYASQLGLSAEPVSPPYFQQAYATTTANMFSNGQVWVQLLSTALGQTTLLAPGQVGTNADTLLSVLNAQGGAIAAAAASIVAGLEASQGATGDNPYLKLVDGAPGGTDFAIGGSVTGPSGANSDTTVALSDLNAQLINFENAVTQPAADALYTVWSGSNDLLNLLDNTALTAADLAADVAASVANEVAMVAALVADGAETVLVLNVPDLGKIPAIPADGAAAASALAAQFNSDLANALATTSFGTARVVLEDTYSLIDAAVANPAAYGLTNVTDPVYTGSFSTDDGSIVSTDPSVQNQYLFFDEMHPTATGHAFIAAQALADLGLPCFTRGTRILCERHGQRMQVAVEALQVGDLVVTGKGRDDGAKPIIWIGRSPFDATRHPKPEHVIPVRIRAGALAEGLPLRDLVVSPGHSLLLDGVLIQAERLVNGATIVRDQASVRGEYFHIELASHDILLSEGVPSESYLDTGNRRAFANATGVVDLHANFTPRDWRETCVELVQDGPILANVRQRLIARAEALGWTRDQEAAPLVLVDGEAVLPRRQLGGPWLYEIPAGSRAIRLISSSAIPLELLAESRDQRRIGLLVETITATDRQTIRELDDAALIDGWHGLESDGERTWRWTDGDAGIALDGCMSLEIGIRRCFAGWTAPTCRNESRQVRAA